MLNQHSAYLLDLVRLRHRTPRLKVENLVNAFSIEDVVATFYPLREAEPPKKRAKVVKPDASIRRAPQHSNQNRLAHAPLCAQGKFQLCSALFGTARAQLGTTNRPKWFVRGCWLARAGRGRMAEARHQPGFLGLVVHSSIVSSEALSIQAEPPPSRIMPVVSDTANDLILPPFVAGQVPGDDANGAEPTRLSGHPAQPAVGAVLAV